MSRQIRPRKCANCGGRDDVRQIERMIGWGAGFQGFESSVPWCVWCRAVGNGHWRWFNQGDAHDAALWRKARGIDIRRGIRAASKPHVTRREAAPHV